MNQTQALYRNGLVFVTPFLLIVTVGFWKSYFSNPLRELGWLIHLHAIAMILWCMMIIIQPALIRTNRRLLHRAIGRSSYVLAPLIVLLMLSVTRARVPTYEGFVNGTEISPEALVFLSQSILSAFAFALLYALAVWFRKTPAIHARLMVCTTLPLLTAPIDRIIFTYIPQLIAILPRVAGAPNLAVVSWIVADAVVLILLIWDWMSERRVGTFSVALVVLLGYQVFTINAHKVVWWEAICHGFLGH